MNVKMKLTTVCKIASTLRDHTLAVAVKVLS